MTYYDHFDEADSEYTDGPTGHSVTRLATPITPGYNGAMEPEWFGYEDEYGWDMPPMQPEINYGYNHNAAVQRARLVLGITVAFIIFGFVFWVAPWRSSGETAVSATNRVGTGGSAQGDQYSGQLAPFFMPSVLYWETLILEVASEYNVDPNMVATIMQIESCGDPQAVSRSGAQGLFQVMPFHFTAGENMQDPQINARRGINYFAERLVQTGGDVGRAFAGYNGGHVAAAASMDQWADETRRYFTWSTGIYSEADKRLSSSATLEQWLMAGGASLCQQAATRLGLN